MAIPLLETVRLHCPELHIPPALFREALAGRAAAPSLEALVEIGLSVACVAGDRAALRRFERRYFGSASRAVAGMLSDADMVDEVMQRLRHRLFVPTDAGPAPVVLAAGRGNLSKFVRVCAIRLALNFLRGERRWSDRRGSPKLDDVFDDPELRLGHAVSAAMLKAAFEHAVAQLTAKQRNLLRHQLIDHLTFDHIATRYGVHRRTVARWLAAARKAVVQGTRAEVERRLGETLPPSGLGDLVHSRLELSITRVLGHSATQKPVST